MDLEGVKSFCLPVFVGASSGIFDENFGIMSIGCSKFLFSCENISKVVDAPQNLTTSYICARVKCMYKVR